MSKRNKIVNEKLLLLLWKQKANVKFSHFIGLFHFYERQNETNRRHKLTWIWWCWCSISLNRCQCRDSLWTNTIFFLLRSRFSFIENCQLNLCRANWIVCNSNRIVDKRISIQLTWPIGQCRCHWQINNHRLNVQVYFIFYYISSHFRSPFMWLWWWINNDHDHLIWDS